MRISEIKKTKLDEGIGVHNDEFDLYLSMYLDSSSSITINLNNRNIGSVTDDPGRERLWNSQEIYELRKRAKDNPKLEELVEKSYQRLNEIRELTEERAQAKIAELTSAYVTMVKAILIEEKQRGLAETKEMLAELLKAQ